MQREIELALIRRAQAGEIAAAQRLVEGHMGVLVNIVRRIVGPARVAEYIGAAAGAALRCVPLFDASRGLRFMTLAGCSAWREVFRLHQLDKRGRAEPAVDAWMPRYVPVADGADEYDFEQRQTAERLVERLPPRQRIAVRMRMQGQTLGAVGKALGVTRERARQVYMKAIYALRRDALAMLQGGKVTKARRCNVVT